MYSMKSIHEFSDKVDHPDGIYNMKSIHGKENKEKMGDEMTPAMKALEERQLNILRRLESLEKDVKEIGSQLGRNYGDPLPKDVKMAVDPLSIQADSKALLSHTLPDGTIDFVISISPNQISLSPILIGDLLQARGVDVAMPTHIHSSCRADSSDFLQRYDLRASGRVGTSTTAKVFLTMVLKEDPFCPSVMYSPLLQTRIIGDVNIARYLCRFLTPDLYNETDTKNMIKTDIWLDISTQIQHGNSKGKDSTLKKLNAHLGQHPGFLCGSSLSIADIVVMSALLSNLMVFKSLPKNVKVWFSKCFKQFKSLNKVQVPNGWVE